jgi:hypothetical protein
MAMSLPSVSPGATVDTGSSQSVKSDLDGRRLVMGQILWLTVAAFGLGVLAASIAPSFHQLQTGCNVSPCTSSQLTSAQAQTLQTTLGLSLGAYAVWALSLSVASALCWVGVGAFLWRKLGQVVPLLAALQLITQGILSSNAFAINGLVDVLAQAHSPWQVPALFLEVANQILLVFVLALFPTGRFVSRWMRWATVLWTAFNLLYFLGHISSLVQSFLPPFIPVYLGVIFLLAIAQVYRYLRVSTGVERQQTKWVLFGIITLNGVQLVLWLPEVAAAPLRQPDSLYGPLAGQVVILGYLFVPVCVAIAILRARLWDIDTLINKALVYGLLTSLLAAIYAGLIIGLESLIGAITGQVANNPLILVISTLAIAALFQPLRKGLQSLIDRRFYRKKYDTEKTLAAFSATLRNQVDLEQVNERLLAVVQETMQPEHVSLWLRQPDRHASEQAHRLDRPDQASTKPSPD